MTKLEKGIVSILFVYALSPVALLVQDLSSDQVKAVASKSFAPSPSQLAADYPEPGRFDLGRAPASESL